MFPGCICARCGVDRLGYSERYADDFLLELHYAAVFGTDEVEVLTAKLPLWRHLVHKQSNLGRTPLMLAAGTAKPNLVHAFFAAGAQPNTADQLGNVALHYAVAAMTTGRQAAVPASHCIDAICARPGANVDAEASTPCCGTSGETPLLRAAIVGAKPLIRRLLAHGAHVSGAELFLPREVFFPITRKSGYPWPAADRRRALAVLHASTDLAQDMAMALLQVACCRRRSRSFFPCP